MPRPASQQRHLETKVILKLEESMRCAISLKKSPSFDPLAICGETPILTGQCVAWDGP